MKKVIFLTIFGIALLAFFISKWTEKFSSSPLNPSPVAGPAAGDNVTNQEADIPPDDVTLEALKKLRDVLSKK